MPASSGNFCVDSRGLTAVACRLLLAAGSLLSPAADAIDTTTLEVARIVGDRWSASDVRVDLPVGVPGKQSRGASLHAAMMTLAGVPQPLRNIAIECPEFRLESRRLRCARARVDAVLPTLGRQQFHAALTYDFAGALEVEIEDLPVGGGHVQGRGTLRDEAWTATLQLRAVKLDALLDLAQAWSMPLPPFSGTGQVTLNLSAKGAGTAPAAIEFKSVMSGLTVANAAGTLASDGLDVAIDGSLERHEGRWNFAVTARSSKGQAYAEPVFLDLGIHQLEVVASGSRGDDGDMTVTRFAIDHQDVLQASGSAELTPGGTSALKQLALDIGRLDFPGAYTSYLQPFLVATGFKALATSGSLSGHLAIAAGQPRQLDLTMDAVSADDGSGKLALSGLEGELHWQDGSASAGTIDSHLEFAGGRLLGLDIGATSLTFRTEGADLELLKPTRIPILDGVVEIERFSVQDAGLPGMAFGLDATLLPISVRRLSRAFGWPEFGGQLGGRISDLRLDNGVLTLATTLEARVFDGRLEVSNLRLEDPFGDWPRLYSSIDIYNLDLEQVTSAFSFGRITGRLSGYVNELVLFNWMPVEFDARLHTPLEDRSRHRISQRAVQNIGNLGGGGAGVGAALSSGLMGFFEDFNYSRLGLSCRLENEVCLMDGVDPAPEGGYYLVKGRGLPRINVIGNAPRVDWPRLVAQIKAIMESEGPVVE